MFDIYSWYLGHPPIQAFTYYLQKEHCQSCNNTLLGKLFRRKNSFSDANLFFFFSPEKIQYPPSSSGSLLLPAPQQKQLMLPANKKKKANKVLEDFLQFTRKGYLSSTLRSFFSLIRHLDDARKPASAPTTSHSVPQSRTGEQHFPCQRGLHNPPSSCHPLIACGSFSSKIEQD